MGGYDPKLIRPLPMERVMTDIRLFSSRGGFLPIDQIESQIDDDVTREHFAPVMAARAVTMQAEADLAEATEQVKALVQELADAETFHKKQWPPPTFMDLWRESIGTRKLVREGKI